MITTIPDPATPLLAVPAREAARILGISPRFLWQLTRDGKIPVLRLGDGKRKRILYSVAQLQRWITDQTAK